MKRLVTLLVLSIGAGGAGDRARADDPGDPHGAAAAQMRPEVAPLGSAANSTSTTDFPAPQATPRADDVATSVLVKPLRVASLPKVPPLDGSLSVPRLADLSARDATATPADGETLRRDATSQPVNAVERTFSGTLSKTPSLPELSPPDSPHQNPATAQRLAKVHRVLDIYRPKLLNTRDHGPWETMHAIVAYGVETQVRHGGPNGKPVTAIGWLAFNNPAAGQRLFYARREGGVGALTGPGLQGHAGQFLAIMAQSRLAREYPIVAGDKRFTIDDLLKYEQETCQPRSELTFKLIAISHYLDSDVTWKSDDGQTWSVPRLIREELAQPINGVTCGGTHRLFGLSYAVFQRSRQGKPIVGEYARAKKFIQDYHKYTYALQNADGSFSTDWFRGRGNKPDLDRRLQTTGHILEWLVFSTPRDQLENPRLSQAVDYLSGIMLAHPNRDWPIGPRGHALHALAIYEARLSRPAAEPTLAAATGTALSEHAAASASHGDQ